ncbi:RNA polymerase subunit sigma [Bacillus sp. M6-12]|uniref:RNA polymerase subunit sigma n=1 Tax=Bacillus sp. M6-12 TaxID=2054166 RepID=UPI000C763F97|nr:RNA polymerase subunit sigma [Bacillus sp. M6-12]PLS17419.1 RNA polymerase subunit sigma [Bacillus sp. M6-12]
MAATIILVLVGAYFVKDNLNDSKENAEPLLASEQTPATQSEEGKGELFVLSAAEEQAYSSFKKDLDVRHLKDLGPINVAKLYVYAAYVQDTEVVYALYTDREDRIQWSMEEDKNIPAADRGTREQIAAQYKNLEKGIFVKTSDFEGYIEFESSKNSGVKSGFQMIQNEGGIWQVAFMPIQ